MTTPEFIGQEQVLRRLAEPEGDQELHAALEHMKRHHWHLWRILHELHLAHDADPAKLKEWRNAEGKREKHWADQRDEALGVLAAALNG